MCSHVVLRRDAQGVDRPGVTPEVPDVLVAPQVVVPERVVALDSLGTPGESGEAVQRPRVTRNTL